ncbi:unnamed protein product [Parnassius apollo]|uniref:Lysozyme n=1 Tax=Parnassius apollo TaxID=110799 RepID=A0A8S3WIT9_PARAO|nr:unnamed protein product [Parnassius apollo]
MYSLALLMSTLLALAGARIYERCELARDLIKLGIRGEHIATWVCIAYHESRFDTAARNGYSGDHGLLQISEIYWCGPGKACGLPCSALRDDDISNDVECALTIYEEHTRLQGDGFLAWVVYPQHCRHNAKKYLADCDISVKDLNYNVEGRSRSWHKHDFYPTVNVTLSNAVQSVAVPQSEKSFPTYLSIISMLRRKFEQDFEEDYYHKQNVNWSQFKIGNVDKLKLPNFNLKPNYDFLQPVATQITTTSTTTMQPEPQYKPVKPWRTIETNQFRRRMMPFNKKSSEEYINRKNYLNTFQSTTPLPSTILAISTTQNSSVYNPPNVKKTIQNTQHKINNMSYFTVSPVLNPSFPIQVSLPVTTFSPLVTRKLSNSSDMSLTQETPKKIPSIKETTKYIMKSTWETYSPWTTPLSISKEISTTQKSVQNWTTKRLNIDKTKTTVKQQQQFSTPSFSKTLTTRPLATAKGYSKENKESSKITALSIQEMSTTVKPKALSVNGALNNKNSSQSKSANDEHSTRRSQVSAWRRGKSWSNDYDNVTYFDRNVTFKPVLTSTSTISPYRRPGKYENSRDITFLTNHTTKSGSAQSPLKFTKANEGNDKQTVKVTGLITQATPRTTFSIFDLYLNPTQRPQLPTYKFAFTSNNVSAPLVMSYPHFLFADSVYSSGVIGLNPEVEEHRVFLDLEPNTGTIVRGAKRAQFNIFLRPITSVTATNNLNTTLTPIVWFEELFFTQSPQLRCDCFAVGA